MMLRWFSVLMLCCVAAPWFNTLRVAVNVAHVKTINRRVASNRLRKDCDTLLVDLSAAEEIKSTGELRIAGKPYDVVSYERVGDKLRVVAFKDDEEKELEETATRSSNNNHKLKSIAIAFQLFFENRATQLPLVLPIELTEKYFQSVSCNAGEHTRLHTPPPKIAA